MEISCPSENVELAVEYISLELRSESRIGGLILESPADIDSIQSLGEVIKGGVQVEKRRGSFTRGVWEDGEDPAKIRRSGQRRGKRSK